MRILLTNDDGYRTDGIHALADLAEARGHELWIVAPDREQSACAHKLTLHEPLRLTSFSERKHAINGTPTDAVYVALYHLMPQKPDLIISGINRGPNMGDDLTYSGTVAGAMEGAVVDIPSISVSVAGFENLRWDCAAQVAVALGEALQTHPLSSRTFLNVNVPPELAPKDAQIHITRLGRRDYRQTVIERLDPRGKPYLWIGGDAMGVVEAGEGTDIRAVENGFVSVSPITLDLTHTAGLDALKDLENLKIDGKTS